MSSLLLCVSAYSYLLLVLVHLKSTGLTASAKKILQRQSQQLVCTSLAEQFSVDLEKEVNPFAHLVFNLSD